MPSNNPTREEQAAVLAKAGHFRDFRTTMSGRWSRRSGVKRAADAVCDELDELAMVVTGDRNALLDPLHKSP